MAVIFLTGYEYGASLGSQNVPDVSYARYWNSIGGTPTYTTSNIRAGSLGKSAAIFDFTAANCSLVRAIGTGIRSLSGRFYIKYTTLPTADVPSFFSFNISGSDATIGFDITTGKIAYGFSTEGATVGSLLVVNTWYRLDFKLDTSANPNRITVAIDGTSGSEVTLAQAASDITDLQTGRTSLANTGVIVVDDAIFTNTTADFPIGAGSVKGLWPDGDGTHVNASRFQNDSSVAISGGNAAYQYVDDDPFPSLAATTDYIKQITGDAGGEDSYCEITFTNTSESSDATALASVIMFRSQATQANNGAALIRDSAATETGVYGVAATPADMSETAPMSVFKLIPAPGGVWSPTEVNALVMRLGYGTDISPVPWWMATMLEVAYPEAIAGEEFPYVGGGYCP